MYYNQIYIILFSLSFINLDLLMKDCIINIHFVFGEDELRMANLFM